MECCCCFRRVATPYHHSNAHMNSGLPPDTCQDCHDAGCGLPTEPCNLKG